MPLTFAPGEAYQFDWSHEIVVMNGVTTIVKVAHVRLCHSRMMFCPRCLRLLNVVEPVADALTKALIESRIDVLILDPLRPAPGPRQEGIEERRLAIELRNFQQVTPQAQV